jgi:hypothetical protein
VNTYSGALLNMLSSFLAGTTAQMNPNVQLPGAGRLQYITRGAVISRT